MNPPTTLTPYSCTGAESSPPSARNLIKLPRMLFEAFSDLGGRLEMTAASPMDEHLKSSVSAVDNGFNSARVRPLASFRFKIPCAEGAIFRAPGAAEDFGRGRLPGLLAFAIA